MSLYVPPLGEAGTNGAETGRNAADEHAVSSTTPPTGRSNPKERTVERPHTGTMSDETMSAPAGHDGTEHAAVGPAPEDRVSIWETGRFPSQRCTARKGDTGEPCKAWAISGGSVCVYHGGRAKQVRDAAKKRLEALVPLALDTLADLMQGIAHDPGSDAPMAVPPSVRSRSATEVLSRAGYPAASAVELDATVTSDPNPALDAAIAAALARRTADTADERM